MVAWKKMLLVYGNLSAMATRLCSPIHMLKTLDFMVSSDCILDLKWEWYTFTPVDKYNIETVIMQ